MDNNKSSELHWSPATMRKVVAALRPITKAWFRSEVRGLELVPSGGALLVSNHSGGLLPMDIPVLAVGFLEHFDFERPLYALGHDILFRGPQAELFRNAGLIQANRTNAMRALQAGATVIVVPGGDYDAFRPSWESNKIDFNGRTGYIRTAMEAGVPIVPAVSIGGQESQVYLARGQWLGKRLGLQRLLRTDVVPVTVGFPFGVSVLLPANLPLPTKIVTQVLSPIDVRTQFGPDPDIREVDAHVRGVMQSALDSLAAARRFPIIG